MDRSSEDKVNRGLTSQALAHLTEEGKPHLLIDHLTRVGEMASEFASKFQAGDIAKIAGTLHDLGKYSQAFQARIRLENGFEAHLEDHQGKPDHSTAGAAHVLAKAPDGQGLPAALAIAGHHGGLRVPIKLKDRLKKKGDCLEKTMQGKPDPELLALPDFKLPEYLFSAGIPNPCRVEFFTRMLYSTLCDADFLDTEVFYDRERASLRRPLSSRTSLQEHLHSFLEKIQKAADPTEVNRIRKEVLAACRKAADLPPGIFSLTVPTGGGKTFSSLAFALDHAEYHGLDRVIVAIPFTSITEQTTEAYRLALGEEAVLEHHSMLDPEKETPYNRIACENWDAPLVVTTTVQLFESLFANRSSACRKLHRIARSVIILDEAQTLPIRLLTPILDALSILVSDYGCSIVICTATQPAFQRTATMPDGFETIREIVPVESNLFERLRRVEVRWPDLDQGPTEYADLAEEITQEKDVLAIVHLRKDARALCELLDASTGGEETFHLSALMCPVHRSKVLETIRERKKSGKNVRLVATQLVEAGVDLDFRVVYRALGGIDSMAQAAGRCNREGKLNKPGELRVFLAPTTPPKGTPERATAIARQLIRNHPDLFSPDLYQRYFAMLYNLCERDPHEIQDLRKQLDFEEIAKKFKIIEDGWSSSLIVPYDAAAATLIEELKRFGPSRKRMRALQKYSVTVPRKFLAGWTKQGCVTLVAETVHVLEAWTTAYHPRFGLRYDQIGFADPEQFIE